MRLALPACLLLILTGCGTPSLLITPVSNATELQEIQVQEGHGGKIALISVDGTLINMKSGGFLEPQENPLNEFVEQLDLAAADDSIKGIVLRINSPGGSVTCSDTMYDAVIRFKAKMKDQNKYKPIIAFAQEVDASGAYYLSCAADKIVANPTSLVGSIGVIFETFDATDTLAKIGMRADAIKSGELKDMGSPFKHMTPHEHDVMQAMVDEYFARFKSIVQTNRPIKTDQAIAAVDDGRVFSGADALQLGLVDQVGRLDDAIDLARQMSKRPDAEVVMYKHAYGYTGSIYADTSTPLPQANVMNLKLPMSGPFLPTGFYYIWEP